MKTIDADALKTDVRRYVLEGTDEFGTIGVEEAERSFLRLIDKQPTIDTYTEQDVTDAYTDGYSCGMEQGFEKGKKYAEMFGTKKTSL